MENNKGDDNKQNYQAVQEEYGYQGKINYADLYLQLYHSRMQLHLQGLDESAYKLFYNMMGDFRPLFDDLFLENYQLTLQIAGNKLRMLPNEILSAATINPAYSLDIDEIVGSIEEGKSADLLLLDCPNLDYFIYHYGINHTQSVFKKGKLVIKNRKVVGE